MLNEQKQKATEKLGNKNHCGSTTTITHHFLFFSKLPKNGDNFLYPHKSKFLKWIRKQTLRNQITASATEPRQSLQNTNNAGEQKEKITFIRVPSGRKPLMKAINLLPL